MGCRASRAGAACIGFARKTTRARTTNSGSGAGGSRAGSRPRLAVVRWGRVGGRPAGGAHPAAFGRRPLPQGELRSPPPGAMDGADCSCFRRDRTLGAQEPRVDEALAIGHGLKPDEYARFVALIGRTPTFTELGIVSAMWNEHCSYKSSRLHLRRLPTKAPWVIQGPGENAGVIDIGDGEACVFKMESHNHPSFIEPYQGSATGVGGILRDVFTMGARPVACLDFLRFGSPEHPKTRHLVAVVIAGIGGYGNAFGVPTV